MSSGGARFEAERPSGGGLGARRVAARTLEEVEGLPPDGHAPLGEGLGGGRGELPCFEGGEEGFERLDLAVGKPEGGHHGREPGTQPHHGRVLQEGALSPPVQEPASEASRAPMAASSLAEVP